MAEKLANLCQFTEFAELPTLTRPSTIASSGMKFGVDSETNTVVASTKRDQITSFATWGRAYYCSMAHHVFHFPQYVLPMLKYFDIIAAFAEPHRNLVTGNGTHSHSQETNRNRNQPPNKHQPPQQPNLTCIGLIQ